MKTGLKYMWHGIWIIFEEISKEYNDRHLIVEK